MTVILVGMLGLQVQVAWQHTRPINIITPEMSQAEHRVSRVQRLVQPGGTMIALVAPFSLGRTIRPAPATTTGGTPELRALALLEEPSTPSMRPGSIGMRETAMKERSMVVSLDFSTTTRILRRIMPRVIAAMVMILLMTLAKARKLLLG